VAPYVLTSKLTGAEQARVHDLQECNAILDVFQKYGHKEIDSARTYGGGSSEEYLGKLNWKERGIIMDTKLSPSRRMRSDAKTYTHKPEELKPALLESLAALNTDKVLSSHLLHYIPEISLPLLLTPHDKD